MTISLSYPALSALALAVLAEETGIPGGVFQVITASAWQFHSDNMRMLATAQCLR